MTVLQQADAACMGAKFDQDGTIAVALRCVIKLIMFIMKELEQISA